MPVFYHEKLPVYQRALEFAILANELIVSLPNYRFDLKDQFWRASTSMPLNIAEGTGGQSDAVRLKHFRIARGSAAECSAIIDYVVGINLAQEPVALREILKDTAAQLGRSFYKHLP